MSYNRSSSSSSGRRPPSERNNDPYYSDRDYRPSSRSSAPSSRSGTSSNRSEPSPYRSSSPRSGDGRSAAATKSPQPRSSSSRPPSSRPSGSKGSSPSNRGNSRRPSTKRRKHKRSPFAVILPLVLIIAVISIVVVALNAFVFNGDKGKDSGDYTLEFSAQTMVVGGTATVTVKGLPEDSDSKVNWSSSDNEIVRVNNGALSAKKVGTVTISASVNGKNITGTVKVIETVEGIKSLTITPNNLSLVSGKTFQLECKPEFEQADPPAVTPTWSSSNSAVVSVSKDGLVTARDVGSVSITATIGNQSATCTITVDKNPDSQPAGSEEGTETTTPDANAGTAGGTTTTPPPATNGGTNSGTSSGGTNAGSNNTSGNTNAGGTTNKPTVTGLSISQKEGQLDVGGTLVLEAYVLPSGGTVKWTSSNNAIASVSANGLVTAKGAGTATVTAKVGTFSQSCKIIVSVPSPDVPEEEAPPQ